jgi:hypothetical protein
MVFFLNSFINFGGWGVKVQSPDFGALYFQTLVRTGFLSLRKKSRHVTTAGARQCMVGDALDRLVLDIHGEELIIQLNPNEENVAIYLFLFIYLSFMSVNRTQRRPKAVAKLQWTFSPWTEVGFSALS